MLVEQRNGVACYSHDGVHWEAIDPDESDEYLTPTRRAQRIKSAVGNLNKEILELRKLGHNVIVGVHDGKRPTYYWPDCYDVRVAVAVELQSHAGDAGTEGTTRHTDDHPTKPRDRGNKDR